MKMLGIWIGFLIASSNFDNARVCRTVSEEKKVELVDYVRAKFKLPAASPLSIDSDSIVNDSCFHLLKFAGASSLKKWQLSLYLSPDERYLTSDLNDLKIDPVREEQAKTLAVMNGIIENKSSSRGSSKAIVTIVEFSDFECPYCRQFAEILKEVLPTENDNVRLIFHHLPLSIHPWALAAAEGAACGQLQSSSAFWSIHDQLFLNQRQITVDDVKAKLLLFAKNSTAIDLSAFESCLSNELSLGVVYRDMELASSFQISATPTIFINGHRLLGVKDAAELKVLIKQAKSEPTLVQPK